MRADNNTQTKLRRQIRVDKCASTNALLLLLGGELLAEHCRTNDLLPSNPYANYKRA